MRATNQLKPSLCALLALGLLTACSVKPGRLRLASEGDGANGFFVATNGNDGWSGRLPAPNHNRTDGPFSSIKTALRYTKGPATILVRNGSYFLEAPLVLVPENSGMTLAAFKGETPVISGGKRITGWKETTIEGKKGWTADISDVREGKWFFHELWVNGRRAIRARHPNHGYLT